MSLSGRQIADLWLDAAKASENCRFERYFFENVKAGIRTDDDDEILRRFREKRAPFLDRPEYSEALRILDGN